MSRLIECDRDRRRRVEGVGLQRAKGCPPCSAAGDPCADAPSTSRPRPPTRSRTFFSSPATLRASVACRQPSSGQVIR
jgi:hypothetical protein